MWETDEQKRDDPQYVKRFVTGKDGFIRINNLPPGNYRMHEIVPPFGYFKIDDFHLGQDDNVLVIAEENGQAGADYTFYRNYRLANSPIVMETLKLLDGQPAPDGMFTFELVDSSGHVVMTATNDELGRTVFDPLMVGFTLEPQRYYLREQITGNTPGVIHDLKEVVLDIGHYLPYGTLSMLGIPEPPRPTLMQDSPAITLGVWAILAMILGELLLKHVTFENISSLTEFSVSKEFRAAEGVTPPEAWPEIHVQLQQDGEDYGPYTTLNGIADDIDPDHPIKADGSGELSPWVYTWKGLPALVEQPNLNPEDPNRVTVHTYHYTANEVVPAQYQHLREVDEDGNLKLVNIYQPGTFTAHKVWNGMAGVPIKLRLIQHDYGNEQLNRKPIGDPVELDGVVNTNPDGSGELVPWSIMRTSRRRSSPARWPAT